ncbi:MAG: FkbM family methyltransferase [Candidatus Zixiibacteriota bacterium]
MNIKNVVKALVLSVLPERALQVLKKAYYPRILRSICERDEKDFGVIIHLVRPGDCVVDIGANIGVYTKFLSDLVGVHGRVLSVEPIPYTFEILCSNIRKLRLANVEPINCAVSNSNSNVTMEVPTYESGGENFYEARIVDDITDSSLRRERVESKTIDSLFLRLPRNISFIKCDVEGHELKCIKGAVKVMGESKPAWLVEISGDPGASKSPAAETFELMQHEGYEAYWFDGRNLNRWSRGDKSVNYFFLTPGHLQTLSGSGILGEPGAHIV